MRTQPLHIDGVLHQLTSRLSLLIWRICVFYGQKGIKCGKTDAEVDGHKSGSYYAAMQFTFLQVHHLHRYTSFFTLVYTTLVFLTPKPLKKRFRSYVWLFFLVPVRHMSPSGYISSDWESSADFPLSLAVTQPKERHPGFLFQAQTGRCHVALLPPLALTRLAPSPLPNQWPSQLSWLVCSVSTVGTRKDRRKEVFTSSSPCPVWRTRWHRHRSFSCSAGADFYQ